MGKSTVYVKTKLSNSAGKLNDYIGNDRRPPKHKSKDKKFVNKINGHHRILAKTSINTDTNYKVATKQMKRTLHKFGYKKNHPQAIHTIISFNPKKFDYKNPNDRKEALKLSKEIISRKYPTSQSLISEQSDNSNHILHVHCSTCAKNAVNGKSNTHNASCARTMPFVIAILKKHNLNVQSPFKNRNPFSVKRSPTVKQSLGEWDSERDNQYSYAGDLKLRIAKAVSKVNPNQSKLSKLKDLSKKLSEQGVSISAVSHKKDKRTGKSVIHFYRKRPAYRGIKMNNGLYIRLRKTWRFGFKDKNGRTRVMRTSKMGNAFTPSNLVKSFGNKKLLNTVKVSQDEASLSGIDTHINNINNKLMNLNESRKKILNQSIKDNPRPKIKTKPLEHKSKSKAEKEAKEAKYISDKAGKYFKAHPKYKPKYSGSTHLNFKMKHYPKSLGLKPIPQFSTNISGIMSQIANKSKNKAEKVSNVQDFYDNLDESSQDAVASRMEIQAQNQEIAKIDYEMEALKQRMARRNAYERQVELIRYLRSRGGPTL